MASKLLESLVPTIYGLIKSANDKLVPPGTIIAFHRATNLPLGWALCDGTNNTPDLRGRFIIATNPTANATNASGISVRNHGSIGGEEEHTLTVAEMPSHDHGGTTGSAGLNIASTTSPGSDGTPNIVADNAGTHTHSISAQGGGDAHNNMPPFYALTYIMKVLNLDV